MSLSLTVHAGTISCLMCVCDGGCKNYVESQKSCKLIEEIFDLHKTTPITRLALHINFERKHRIDKILYKYKKIHNRIAKIEGPMNPEKRMELLEYVIIDDCKMDSDWKICNKCESEYINNARLFENILFTVPELKYCSEHQIQCKY